MSEVEVQRIVRAIISSLFTVFCSAVIWGLSWWLWLNKWVSWLFVVVFLIRLVQDDRLWKRSSFEPKEQK